MYDAALYYSSVATERSRILSSLDLEASSYILATVHRAENTDDPASLQTIFKALTEIAQETVVVLPLHPRTANALRDEKIWDWAAQHICFIKPVGYLDMVMLEKNASFIVTDSGGVQKEAFFHRVPCVTIRSETEWIELVEAGWNVVVPPTSVEALIQAIKNPPLEKKDDIRLYGEGNASQRIITALDEFIKNHFSKH